jgi:Bromodomain
MSTPPSSTKSPPVGSFSGPSPTDGAAAAATASAAAASSSSPAGAGPPNEDDLRRQLRSLMQKLKEREPLDPTYRRLLMNGVVTRRKPILSKDKFYKRIGSSLRQRVEAFVAENQGKDPFDKISQRQELEEDKMRAALNLREFKPHEQQPLLAATLAAVSKQRLPGSGMDGKTRRRYLDSVALGLQTTKKMRRADVSAAAAAAAARFGVGAVGTGSGGPASAAVAGEQQQQQQQQQTEQVQRLKEQARAREVARRKREELERQRREHENKTWNNRTGGGGGNSNAAGVENNTTTTTTPQQALYKVYQPIFKILWDMEFPYLNGSNPFRIPIDRDNCASMGAADYFDVIDVPMNLTYIQHKVEGMEYKTLSAFFDDVELVIRNALLYNTNVDNPYRVAAEELQKKYKRVQKKVLMQLQQKKAAATAAAAGSR